MQRRFHALAGAAGALICGFAATLWCAFAPPPFVAGAIVAIQADDGAPAAYEAAALRALAVSDAVLRKAALTPDAASAIARAARPGALSPLFGLLAGQSGNADTLSRAADLLAARIGVEPAPAGQGTRIVLHMEDAESAALVANAVAQAVVAAHNEASARIDRRLDQSRGQRLARAERRREAARARLAAVQASDAIPTAVIAPARTPPSTPATLALAEAQRAATTAETRRAEAARIYGPRHPEMIQFETEARRATAALKAAHAKVAATPAPAPRPLAEGGPDPRGPALLEAQEELALAEAAYEKEAVRFAAPEREARVLEPATPPRDRQGARAPVAIAASALLGFLLFGGAPLLGAGPARLDRPHARLRRGALDSTGARRILEALDIGASEGARRVCIAGESARGVRQGVRALAQAAMEAGWRPLAIGDASDAECGAPGGTVRLAGRMFATRTIETPSGERAVAHPAPGRRATQDVDLAFDLVIHDDALPGERTDIAIWVGAHPPDMLSLQGRATATPVLWIAPA